MISNLSFAFRYVRLFASKYTGWSKKTDTQFYFWDNFGNSAPILTIFFYCCKQKFIPRKSLCTCVRRLSTAASTIRYSAFFGGSAMPAQHSRSTGLLCGRPFALELSTRQLERSGYWQIQLQASAEDEFIYTVLKHLAYLRCFRTIRSTNWLTYLLT